MKKEKGLSGRAIQAMVVLLLLSFIIPTEVHAGQNRSGESKAVFEFMPGGGEEAEPTPIVDPELPQYSIEPDADENGENGVTGNTAELRIDYVSNFSFGSQPISSHEQVFHAALIQADAEHTADGRIEVPAFVQVTDLRGTARGWTLSVRQNDYFTVSSGEYTGTRLTGARLILSNIRTNAVLTEERAEAVREEIIFDTVGEYHNLMTASGGQGTGIQVAHFGEYDQGQKNSALSSVSLEVPAAVRKIAAPYQTSFTWLLADVPANGDEDGDIGEKIDDAEEGDLVDIDGDEWIILSKDEKNGTAELIRKEIVAERVYQKQLSRDWQWSTSELRSWLRTEFINTLSEEFRNMIMVVPKSTKLPSDGNGSHYTESDETVYLLGRNEYTIYSERYEELHVAAVKYWWLRDASTAYQMDDDDNRWGTAYAVEGDGTGRVWQRATDTESGIRPVVTVSYK